MFGLVDDAAIAAVIAGWLLGEADNYLTWERRGMFVVPGKTLPGETLYRGVVGQGLLQVEECRLADLRLASLPSVAIARGGGFFAPAGPRPRS